jgi:hypothetical protein
MKRQKNSTKIAVMKPLSFAVFGAKTPQSLELR